MANVMMNREDSKKLQERVKKLYSDWASTRKSREISEVRTLLKEASTPGSARTFTEVIRAMGADGETLMKIYSESWQAFGDSPAKAKNNLAKMLFKSTPSKRALSEANQKENDGSVVTEIGMSYYPIADRSNQMQSVVDANDRDVVIQVRHAMAGGNMAIAKELLSNAWGSLSLKERNGLIEWVNSMAGYNVNVEGYEDSHVPKNKGTVMKKLEKKSDMTKNEYIEGLVMTAVENMKVS